MRPAVPGWQCNRKKLKKHGFWTIVIHGNLAATRKRAYLLKTRELGTRLAISGNVAKELPALPDDFIAQGEQCLRCRQDAIEIFTLAEKEHPDSNL